MFQCGPSTLDFFSGGNIPSIPIRVELNLSHWPLVDGMGWSVSFASTSVYRGQPPTDSQSFNPDLTGPSQVTHSGQ